MELENRVAIVTGSARGIGLAIASAFAARRAKVAMVDLLAGELQTAAKDLRSKGSTALPLVADTTDPEEVRQAVEQAERDLGPVDVLVNNAGTFSVIGPVWEVDTEKWFRDVRVNLYGSFLMCNAVLRHMVRRKNGYVINIVSSGGVGDPHPHSTSYASSKTGLMRLTEGIAAETAEHGIKVFAVAPPAIFTEMTRFIMNDPGGRKWRPGFGRGLAEHGYEATRLAELVVALTSGDADCLSGRYIDTTAELETLIADADRIRNHDLLTLRIRLREGEPS